MTGTSNSDPNIILYPKDLLPGGGEMGERIRSFDWSKTSLGPIPEWPHRLRTTVDLVLRSPASIIILWGQEGLSIYNDAYIGIAGTRHPSSLGISCEKAWPENADFIHHFINKCLQGEALTYKNHPLTVFRNNRKENIWADLQISPIPDDTGKPGGVLLMKIETTEIFLAEEALKESGDLFRRVVEGSNEGIWDYNIESRQAFWNDRLFEFMGLSREEVEKPGYDFLLSRIHPDDKSKVEAAFQRTLKEGLKYDVEYRIKHKSGHYIYFHARAKPVFNEEGKITRIAGIGMDVTSRKKAEEALLESEERYRTMAEASGILIAHTDQNGKHVYFNKEWLNLTGLPMKELTNFGWEDLLHPDDRDSFVHAYTSAFEKREVLKSEFRLRNQQGEYRWQFAIVSPRFGTMGTFAGFISSCVDITELKRTEEELKKFKLMSDHAFDAFILVREDGSFAYLNDLALERWGYTKDETKSLRIPDVDPIYQEDKFKEMFSLTLKQGAIPTFETIHKRKDGTTFPVEVTLVGITFGNEPYVFAIARDISERKFADNMLKDRNKQLQITNNDLDTFIYTASHDLKAPISNLEGLLRAFALDNQFNEEQQGLIEMMFQSIYRFKTTIKDLTEISKIQRLNQEDLQALNFEDILNEVKLDIRELIEKFNPVIETEFNIPSINYSKKNMRSIIYNLLSNALKYSSPDRQPVFKISTEKEKIHTVLKISDNGLGIAQENLWKVFTMFKRAHQHVEGSGIGLYMIKRMIENAGGQIKVESEEGKGTIFTVYFMDKGKDASL